MPSYGSAGASAQEGTWSSDPARARRGASYERRTAKILDAAAARSGAVAMHDLDIPVRLPDGGRPNIDHVLVVGRRVYLIDTKGWKPGFVWTMGGRSRRGWEPFAPADSKTMAMARDAVSSYLSKRGVSALVGTYVVVWPTSTKAKLRLWALRIPGSKVMHSSELEAWASRTCPPNAKRADPKVVAALARLLKSTP